MASLDHLAVYLSNSCNLSCSYCYVAVNQGPQARLSFEDVARAVDEFYAKVPPPDRKITFLGGEPLLDWDLFVRCARYARERGGRDAVLQTFTNGVLLTAAKVRALDELGVHCTVSLDGRKEDNDRHRAFRGGASRSVHDEAMARLRPLDKSRLGVSLVFTASTVDRLLSNVHAFHAMGFGRVTFNPELYEAWPDDRLLVMRRALSGLARWYRALLDAGTRPPQIQILFAVLRAREEAAAGPRRWRDCHNMVLGPDARYYSCDKALSVPVGAAPGLRTGDVRAGLDWGERTSQLDALLDLFEDDAGDAFCPIGVAAKARLDGRDPAVAVREFRRSARVFAEGLEELVERCAGHPAFEDIYGRVRVV